MTRVNPNPNPICTMAGPLDPAAAAQALRSRSPAPMAASCVRRPPPRTARRRDPGMRPCLAIGSRTRRPTRRRAATAPPQAARRSRRRRRTTARRAARRRAAPPRRRPRRRRGAAAAARRRPRRRRRARACWRAFEDSQTEYARIAPPAKRPRRDDLLTDRQREVTARQRRGESPPPPNFLARYPRFHYGFWPDQTVWCVLLADLLLFCK